MTSALILLSLIASVLLEVLENPFALLLVSHKLSKLAISMPETSPTKLPTLLPTIPKSVHPTNTLMPQTAVIATI
jgi:hypothetical protein